MLGDEQHVPERRGLLDAVSGALGVGGRALEELERRRRFAPPEPELSVESECAAEPGLVAELLEHRDGSRELAADAVVAVVRASEHADLGQAHGCVRDGPVVARRSAAVDRLGQDLLRAVPLAVVVQRLPEHRQQDQASRVVRRVERRRATEEVERRPDVAASRRPRPRRREPRGRLRRQAVVLSPELGAVAMRLLEVVADDLVQLDELGAVLVEPARRSARAARRGSPSGARRTRRRGSAGGGSGTRPRPGSCGRSGRRSSLRTSAVSARRQRVVVRRRAPAPRRDGTVRPSTEPRSSTFRSDGSSWSRRAASSAWIVGGTTTSPSPRSRTSATISSTNSGFPSAASRIRVRGARRRPPAASRLAISASVSPRAERLEQHGRRVQLAAAPARSPVEQFRPGHAEQQDRRVARESATCSTRSRNVVLAPVDVVEDDDERRRGATASSSLRNAQAISSTRGDQYSSPSTADRRDRVGRARDAARGVGAEELLDDLDHRPVRDALAVGEAAPAHDGRVEAGRGTRGRGATCPRRRRRARVNSWHELSRRAWSNARAAGASSRSRPTIARVVAPRRRASRRRRRAGTPDGLPPCPSASSGSTALDATPVAHELVRLRADEDLAGLRPPAPAAQRR